MKFIFSIENVGFQPCKSTVSSRMPFTHVFLHRTIMNLMKKCVKIKIMF